MIKNIGKKGDIGWLVYVLISLASFAVIVALIGAAYRGCEKVYDLRACHDALLTYDLMYKKVESVMPVAKSTVSAKKPWPEQCKPKGPVEISGNTDEAIMRSIAEKMRNCYWALGESSRGGFDPFADTWLIRDTKCFNCFILTVKMDKNHKIPKEDFNQWLILNHLNKDPNQPTYWNYFRSQSADGTWHVTIDQAPLVLDDILPDAYYAITYQDARSSALLFDVPKDVTTDSVFFVDINDASSKCGEFSP